MQRGTIEKRVLAKKVATDLMGWEHEPGKPGYCGYYHFPGPYYFPFSTSQRPSFKRDEVQWYAIADQYFEPWKHQDQAALVIRRAGEVGGSPAKSKIIDSIVTDHIHKHYRDCGARELYRLLAATPEKLFDAVIQNWDYIVKPTPSNNKEHE